MQPASCLVVPLPWHGSMTPKCACMTKSLTRISSRQRRRTILVFRFLQKQRLQRRAQRRDAHGERQTHRHRGFVSGPPTPGEYPAKEEYRSTPEPDSVLATHCPRPVSAFDVLVPGRCHVEKRRLMTLVPITAGSGSASCIDRDLYGQLAFLIILNVAAIRFLSIHFLPV